MHTQVDASPLTKDDCGVKTGLLLAPMKYAVTCPSHLSWYGACIFGGMERAGPLLFFLLLLQSAGASALCKKHIPVILRQGLDIHYSGSWGPDHRRLTPRPHGR